MRTASRQEQPREERARTKTFPGSASRVSVAVVSDIHYAAETERARGNDFELRFVSHPVARFLLGCHRKYFWLRDPVEQGGLLDRFIAEAATADWVVGNGDYSCDTASLGVCEPGAFESAQACLEKLRRHFGSRLRCVMGDHELGKFSFIGRRGGLRMESYQRACRDLRLEPCWQTRIGRYVLVGVTSTLAAMPVFEAEALPEERAEWRRLQNAHLEEIGRSFAGLDRSDRVILFCHDPTALPFLYEHPAVRDRLGQIERTIIGHLHSNLILRASRCLRGLPSIAFAGNTVRRLSAALRRARHWEPFKVRLCPALAGIELLKDGGYLRLHLQPEGRSPLETEFRAIPR